MGTHSRMKRGRDPTTLTYWNGRGLCETIRFMLAATGEEYEEQVPGFEGATHLSEPEQMASLRSKGLLVFNQVPLLRIDGLDLVQSKAIVRYLAEKCRRFQRMRPTRRRRVGRRRIQQNN